MSPLLVYVDYVAKCCDCSRDFYNVYFYAHDIHVYILLLTPTVSELQNLLNTCRRELQTLDPVINVKNSYCLSA